MQNANIFLTTNPRPDNGARNEVILQPDGEAPLSDLETYVSSEQGPIYGEDITDEAKAFTLQTPDSDGVRIRDFLVGSPSDAPRQAPSTIAEPGIALFSLSVAETVTPPASYLSAEPFTDTHAKPDQASVRQITLPNPGETDATLTRPKGAGVILPEVSDVKNPSPISQYSPLNKQGSELSKFQHVPTPQPNSQPTIPDASMGQKPKPSPEAVTEVGVRLERSSAASLSLSSSPSETLGNRKDLSGNTKDSSFIPALATKNSQPIPDSLSQVLHSGPGLNKEGHTTKGAKPVHTVAPERDNILASNSSDPAAQKTLGAELLVSDSKSSEPPRTPISFGYNPKAAPDHQKIETGLVTIREVGKPPVFNKPDLVRPDSNHIPASPKNQEPEMAKVSVWQESVETSALSKSNTMDAYITRTKHPELASDNSTKPATLANAAVEVVQVLGVGPVIGNDTPLRPVLTSAFAMETPFPHQEVALSRHVASQITEVARSAPDRPVDLTLNPEELGRIRLAFNTENGVLSVSVTAERPETLELMRRHIETLAQELRNIGYRDVNIGFGQSGKNPNASTFGQSAENGNASSADAQTDPEASSNIHLMTRTSNLHGKTGIDLRL